MSLRNTAVAAVVATCAFTGPGSAEELIANLQQGTNMALALSPDGETIVVDLVGQLWELPVTGGAANPLTPIGQPARNPRFSPDGRYVVYQQSTANQWDLWLLDISSGQRRQLTEAPYNEREPEFSPDSGSVLFASDQAGSFDIWELVLSSNELRQRSRVAGEAAFPTISDHGDIAYINRQGARWTLEILQPDGTGVAVVEAFHPLHAPSWRPGAGLIIYTEQAQPTENNLRMIVLSEDPVIKTLTRDEDVFAFRPAWLSPGEYLYTADGGIWRRTLASTTRSPVLLFAGVGVTRASHTLATTRHIPSGPQQTDGIRAPMYSPSGNSRTFTALGDIWLQSTGGQAERLMEDVYLDIDPAFSPDEEFLVFASDRAGDMDLWQLILESKELQQLTNEPGKSYRPSISPDGRQIAFLHTQGFGPWSESSLRISNLTAGGNSRILLDGLVDADRPIWETTGRLSVEAASLENPGITARLIVDVASGAQIGVADATTTATETDTAADLYPLAVEWTPLIAGDEYVIQVDRLFDGVRNQYRRHMDIHVRDGRITDIVARGLLPAPARIIDALDYTIIPGLIDLHAHQSALSGERLGRIWLSYGVTTVREVESETGDSTERREAWASGQRTGPRLLLTSIDSGTSILSSTDKGEPEFDVLSLHSSQPRTDSNALLETARKLGIPIFSNQLLPAARFGVNGIEHLGGRTEQPYSLERSLLDRSYQDVISILAQTRTLVTPTLAAFGGLDSLTRGGALWSGDAAFSRLYHDYERAEWQTADANTWRIPQLQQTIVEIVRAGGRISAGSDAPTVPYGLGLHAELALLAEAGLANDQVLRIATAEAALALGLERDLGTIEPGRLADFVVLSGDPLARITDSLNIEAVVKNGVWLDREELMAPR